MLKLGIITTIADAADSIEAFIYYHQQIGFEHFYIFIDDNDLDLYEKLKQYPKVNVFLKDDELRSAWGEFFPRMQDEKLTLIDREVMVRQELNFYFGYDLAKTQGVDWLVHIDSDELFYPNGHELSDYFARLQLSNVRAVTYLNYESISSLMHSDNIYMSSHYFKVNYLRYKQWVYNKEQVEYLKSNDWLKEKYFLYYQNGKSSVSTYGRNIKFYDVHSIFGDGVRKLGGHADPIILHYPCARYVDFEKKYKRLGYFSDVWLGLPRAGDFIDTMHLDARNFVNSKECPDLESFYSRHFLMNETQIEGLCKLDLARRIDFPIKLLSNLLLY